jgi:Putative peptidoglycan binding domain
MNEKPQVVRSPEPGVGSAREAEERRRVAEIAREIEELGCALEGRDRLARSATAERAKSSPAQAGQPVGRVGDHSTPESEPLLVVADATIPASPQQRKLVAEGGPPTRRRKWRTSLAVEIILLSLVAGGALMLMGPPIEIAQGAYRSAVAEIQRLTARENAETEATARKAAEEKALAEEAEWKAAEKKKAVEEKAKAEAAREMAEVQARAAVQEAARRQAAEDARLEAEEAVRKATEGKPKSDAEVRQQAERAEADLNLYEQDRKRVQVALNSLGHEISTVTGYFGPRTRAMITAWQQTQGLPKTGYLTKAQLATLQQQAAAALAKYDQSQRRAKEGPRGTK